MSIIFYHEELAEELLSNWKTIHDIIILMINKYPKILLIYSSYLSLLFEHNKSVDLDDVFDKILKIKGLDKDYFSLCVGTICNNEEILNNLSAETLFLLFPRSTSLLAYDILINIKELDDLLKSVETAQHYLDIILSYFHELIINNDCHYVQNAGEDAEQLFLTLSSNYLNNNQLAGELYYQTLSIIKIIIDKFQDIDLSKITGEILVLLIENNQMEVVLNILRRKTTNIKKILPLNKKIFYRILKVLKEEMNNIFKIPVILDMLLTLSDNNNFAILLGKVGLIELLFSYYSNRDFTLSIKIQVSNILNKLFMIPQNRIIAYYRLSIELVELIKLLENNNAALVKSVLEIANSLSDDSNGFKVLSKYKSFMYGLVQYTYHRDEVLQLLATKIIKKWITSPTILAYLEIDSLFYMLQCDFNSLSKHILFILYKKLKIKSMPLINRLNYVLHIGNLYFQEKQDENYKPIWCVLTTIELFICSLPDQQTYNKPMILNNYKSINIFNYDFQLFKDPNHLVIQIMNNNHIYKLYDNNFIITKRWYNLIKNLSII